MKVVDYNWSRPEMSSICNSVLVGDNVHTYSLSQRRPAVPSGQIQVLWGPQAAPCWQGGTQGVVTAAGTSYIARVLMQSEGKERSFSLTHTHTHTLTRFTKTSSKSFGTAAPVEAHTHSTTLARYVTLNRLWGRKKRENRNGLTSKMTQYSWSLVFSLTIKSHHTIKCMVDIYSVSITVILVGNIVWIIFELGHQYDSIVNSK